jgi:hypothetical protein
MDAVAVSSNAAMGVTVAVAVVLLGPARSWRSRRAWSRSPRLFSRWWCLCCRDQREVAEETLLHSDSGDGCPLPEETEVVLPFGRREATHRSDLELLYEAAVAVG